MISFMSESSLVGVAILVANDDYRLAQEVCTWLRLVGAEVTGPVAGVAEVRQLLDTGRPIDGALLKCDLRDGSARAIALELESRGIPFACVGGSYSGDRTSVPSAPMTPYAAVSALLNTISARPRAAI
jgi:hypothetical protein